MPSSDTEACTKNIRLVLEYDGTDYVGWQVQPDGPTIQETLEKSLAQVHGKTINVVASGRTDSGVHAMGQVVNFTSDREYEGPRWRTILNGLLPETIRVLDSQEVSPDFHAQKSATSKTYEYRILNRRYASALDRRVLFYPKPLNWDEIRRALPLFVGTHDFKAFQGARPATKTTVRTVTRFELLQEGDLHRLIIEGTGFLKQMVRNIVGTLLEIGEGRRTVESLAETFASGDRRQAGRTAAPEGLYLVEVKYGQD